jgi:nitroreductase
MDDLNQPKSLQTIIRSRRSIRSFSKGTLSSEYVNEILKAAIYAPYAATATGLPLSKVRKIFVFTIGTNQMEVVKEILLSEIASFAKKMRIASTILPFLKKKTSSFSNKQNTIVKNGIPSLTDGSYFIVIAEKKGFPSNEKQSLAHVMQNIWLTATNLNIGFQLLSVVGILSNNQRFLELLKLPKNQYQLDGCIIGIPKDKPEEKPEINVDEFITWIL